MRILIFLFFLILFSLTHTYEISPHFELQALHFEEIGNLKLISQTRELNFFINLTNIESSLDLVKSLVVKCGEKDPGDENYQKKLKGVEKFVEVKKLEFIDLTSRFPTIVGFHGEKIGKNLQKRDKSVEEEIQSINDKMRIQQQSIQSVKKATDVLITENQQLVAEIDKNECLAEINRITNSISHQFDAIFNTQIHKKLDNFLVNFDEFQNELERINATFAENEELPYENINEFYHNLKIRHEIIQSNLKLTLDVPIAQKEVWTLYKIDEFPARRNDSLLVTNVGWKFFANSSGDFTMLMNLESCYLTKSFYLCEPHAAIYLTSDENCLTKTFTTLEVDPELCETVAVTFERLVFIQLGNGRYFYYSPDNETITITCNKTETNETITQSGVITVESGCKVETPKYTLIPTQLNNSTLPYTKILKTGFNVENLKAILIGNKTDLTDNAFYGNVEKLTEGIKIAEGLEDIVKLKDDGVVKTWMWYVIGGLVIAVILACCLCRFACCCC